jgi:hypothetical protein
MNTNDEMGGACGTSDRNEKYMQGFGAETRRDEMI